MYNALARKQQAYSGYFSTHDGGGNNRFFFTVSLRSSTGRVNGIGSKMGSDSQKQTKTYISARAPLASVRGEGGINKSGNPKRTQILTNCAKGSHTCAKGGHAFRFCPTLRDLYGRQTKTEGKVANKFVLFGRASQKLLLTRLPWSQKKH